MRLRSCFVALTGVAAALAARSASSAPAALAFGVAVLAGVVTGVVNGTLIAYLRVPAFVATLAMLTIARGLSFIISDGRSIGNLPDSFALLGRSVVLGVPTPVIVMAVVMLVGHFVLARTVFGRHVYSVGGNSEAAWLAGVDIRRVLWLVYVLNGAFAGLAGVTLASRLGAGVPNAGMQYELDVIAAVVVGGTSLTGARGSIAGTLAGTVFIGVLTNGFEPGQRGSVCAKNRARRRDRDRRGGGSAQQEAHSSFRLTGRGIMGFDQYHEPAEELSQETRTFARMIVSMIEEAEAINWYEQRMSVEKDKVAVAIMRDAQKEEFKHFGMDLEFLLRKKPLWKEILQGILFQPGSIVKHATEAEENA